MALGAPLANPGAPGPALAARILVVDDEADVVTLLSRTLSHEGYEVATAGSAAKALELLDHSSFDLMLTDLTMPGMDGIELLSRLRERGDATRAIVISGVGTIAHAVRAIKAGALDFVEKPVHRDRLLVTVHNALRFAKLEEAHDRIRAELASERALIGTAPAMQRLHDLVARVAPSDGRVLITGEGGSGKELVAADIHAGSTRAAGPFVKLNCGAVAKELVESELFGHEKGAFTGAKTSPRSFGTSPRRDARVTASRSIAAHSKRCSGSIFRATSASSRTSSNASRSCSEVRPSRPT